MSNAAEQLNTYFQKTNAQVKREYVPDPEGGFMYKIKASFPGDSRKDFVFLGKTCRSKQRAKQFTCERVLQLEQKQINAVMNDSSCGNAVVETKYTKCSVCISKDHHIRELACELAASEARREQLCRVIKELQTILNTSQ